MNPHDLTIASAREGLRKKEFSALELAEAYLGGIEAKNAGLNAYLEAYGDVIAQAKEAQKLIDEGGDAPLLGIPLALKDNILVKGKRASSASKMLENYVASYDSTVAAKLKAAGAVFLGRTNMDEFAMGASTENSAYGPTKNPHDQTRVAGGSSGGAAAAVAADLALAALGSDTGGSIRQPAAFCGVVGLKPTYGAVSRHGLMSMASSLDQIGPLTKTVGDAETIFEAIKGRDRMDSTTIPDGLYPKREAGSRLVAGVPGGILEMEGLDASVKDDFKRSLEKLSMLGFDVVDIPFPSFKYALSVYYIIVPAEVSSNLARYDGVKYGLHKDGKNLIEDYFETRGEGFGKETRRRILIGTYVLSSGYYDAFYGKANAVRRIVEKDFDAAFEKVDVLVTPTTPTPAFKIGEKSDDPLAMYLADIFTVTANIGGICAITVPSGSAVADGKELPLALQIMAGRGREDLLFKAGRMYLGEN